MRGLGLKGFRVLARNVGLEFRAQGGLGFIASGIQVLGFRA